MIIRQTKAIELSKVLAFYNTCNYGGGTTLNDVIVCAEQDGKILGVVRLCIENNILVLRGMQVDKQFQRQGIGKALLKHLNKIIGTQTCYCIPYGHLEHFYSSIGFEKIEEAHIPSHLLQRLHTYKQKDQSMIVMKK